MIRDAYVDTAQVAAALLRCPELAARWAEPSALADFSVAGLARHLANQVTSVPHYLGGAPGEADAAIPLLHHYTRNEWVTSGADGADNVSIRRRSEQAIADVTPGALADEVDASIERLRRGLPGEQVGRVVDLGDWGLTIEDFLVTRIMELVVHSDDLAVSLDVPTPVVPESAYRLTTDLLSRVAAWRHGPLAVVRALSRAERAPATVSAF